MRRAGRLQGVRKLLRSRSGATLTELVVTFVLVGLFAVAVVDVIGSSLNFYRVTSGRARAQTVSETLLEKVSGELAGAQPGADTQYGIIINDDSAPATGYLSPAQEHTCAAFCNRAGSQVYITGESGYLVVHYRPVTENGRNLHAVDWAYDQAVYNGYVIDSLEFTILTTPGNVIRVDLTLRNESTGYTYDAQRYVKCSNFVDVVAVSKITYGDIAEDSSL